MRKSISAEERLRSAGMSQQTLSYNFRVGRTTISNILREVCQAIHDVLSPIYLEPPSKEEEWRSIVKGFEEMWDLPHTLGAIDGKHIRMDCPKNTGTYYHNYKDFFSLVLLAVCDARYTFTLVDVGSNNDSGVLKN